MPDSPTFINIAATNFGPGIVNLSMIQAQYSTLWTRLSRKTKHAVIMFDYTNPMSAKLPAKVEPGDRIDLLLPYDEACFLKDELTHVGISDFYGRIHWASKKQLRTAREQWLNEFKK